MKTLNHDQILNSARQFVREELSRDASGHDWWHIHRVAVMARRLATECGADIFVCELTALLHDIGDYKLRGDTGEPESAIPRRWMEANGVPADVVDHVCVIIDTMSYSKSLDADASTSRSLEWKVVQDADRLDSMGAIGIARTFAYGGSKGRLMYDPDSPPVLNQTTEQYRSSTGASLNHFHEKLLLLKDLMNTEPARRIAQQRHQYMEDYLKEFHAEWNGER